MKIEVDSHSVVSASLHTRRALQIFGGIDAAYVPLLLLHCWACYNCYGTMGEPLAAAVAKQDAVEWEHTTNGTDPADIKEPPALPSALLPSFAGMLVLAACLFLHGLVFFMQIWSVRFRCWLKFPASGGVGAATHVRLEPVSHRGATSLAELRREAARPGQPESSRGYFFMLHNRKFVLSAASAAVAGTAGRTFSKVRPPTKLRLGEYVDSRGLASGAAAEQALALHGANKCDIASPTFREMYFEQLQRPLSVFQLFCVSLWCLDEYWQYSVFTLFMMLLFEGTVVMSRLQSAKSLRGMTTPPGRIQVFRDGTWGERSSEELCPGDLVSVKRGKKGEGENVVPADCLVLSGRAVVNEASLTGESVPQMKEAMMPEGPDREVQLDIKAAHKVHVLFAGSILMQNGSSSDGQAPPTPDGGCVCYVLRTGFSSTQGKLVRRIEFGTQKGNSSDPEAIWLLFFLMLFALCASGYVLNEGLKDKDRSQWELLLHCILIITSVIPPELPMQTALAINQSLVALMGLQVFCTEPFRIPMAGKTDTCLFDKTGTITTDDLVVVGLVGNGGGGTAPKAIQRIVSAPVEACLVLAGCHSLVQIEGELQGDPVERSGIVAIQWDFDATSATSAPAGSKTKTGVDGKDSVTQPIKRPWNPDAHKARAASVTILHRHHFQSKLQRMSVIARVSPAAAAAAPTSSKSTLWSLVKGSPEKIGELLMPGTKPSWYDATHVDMARKGMRVIALAYRAAEAGAKESELCARPRQWAEENLQFAGFIAFRCLTRKDSAGVLKELIASDHHVAMITGDAIMTGIHVAAEVGIVTELRENILILTTVGESREVQWTNAVDDSVTPFVAAEMPHLVAQGHSLCVSGKSLKAGLESSPDMRQWLDQVSVFARMAPEEKETVVVALREKGHFSLMCGDGANDVGALKQAHIGVALLSGFGSLNVDKTSMAGEAQRLEVKKQEMTPAEAKKLMLTMAKPHLFETAKRMKLEKEAFKQKNDQQLVNFLSKQPGVHEHLKEYAKWRRMHERQVKMKAENLKKRAEAKEAADKEKAEFTADFNEIGFGAAMKKYYAKQSARSAANQKKQLSGGDSFAKSAGMHAQLMAEFEGEGLDDDPFAQLEAPMVKLGDASVAAPFVSKMPSIKGNIDIIRQGRCTLVTTLQMYMILALNCLISSYALSVLYLDGIKYGDKQMTVQGLLMTVAFITVSQAKPMPELSPVRPLQSIFQAANFSSLLGQWAVHIGCMYYATSITRSVDPVTKRTVDGTFSPSLLNTVVFFMSATQQVCVFAVNYKGRPFMQGITENKPLIASLVMMAVVTVFCAMEVVPSFNRYIQLTPMHSNECEGCFAGGHRQTILALLCINAVVTFVWDRFCLMIFAPRIFRLSFGKFSKGDVVTLGKILAVCLVVSQLMLNFDWETWEKEQMEEERVSREALCQKHHNRPCKGDYDTQGYFKGDCDGMENVCADPDLSFWCGGYTFGVTPLMMICESSNLCLIPLL